MAAHQAAPGGGSVAAVSAALAAGLVAMAARHSLDRVSEAAGLVDQSERWAAEALDLADRDAAAYAGVLTARVALRSAAAAGAADDEVDARARLGEALAHATAVPSRVAELATETSRAAALLAAQGKPDVRGDAYVARLLADAAGEAAARLVELNQTAAERTAGSGPAQPGSG